MKTGHYVIVGNPIPLARARHGNGKTWDSQKQQKFGYGVQLANQHSGKPYFDGPIYMEIDFYFPVPKHASKDVPGSYHHIKPDLSNLIKFVEDCGIGILYHDDCIIAAIKSQKHYDENPRTEITILEIALP